MVHWSGVLRPASLCAVGLLVSVSLGAGQPPVAAMAANAARQTDTEKAHLRLLALSELVLLGDLAPKDCPTDALVRLGIPSVFLSSLEKEILAEVERRMKDPRLPKDKAWRALEVATGAAILETIARAYGLRTDVATTEILEKLYSLCPLQIYVEKGLRSALQSRIPDLRRLAGL